MHKPKLFFTLFTIFAVLALPALAWERAKGVPYDAVTECESDNLCMLIGCPAPGKPEFGLWLFEHGKMTGETVVVHIDGVNFPLQLPERNAEDLYHWDLDPTLASALQVGKSASIVVEPPDGQPAPMSLRGSGKAIGRVLAACSTMPAPSAVSSVSYLGGLSDNEGCAIATTEGVVLDRRFVSSGAELEGFDFQDSFGTGFINISLPDAMPNKAVVHAQLIQMLQPGVRLRILSQGCGAAGRIVVLSAATKLGQTLQLGDSGSASSEPGANVGDTSAQPVDGGTNPMPPDSSAISQKAKVAAASTSQDSSAEAMTGTGNGLDDGVTSVAPLEPTQPQQSDTLPIPGAPAGQLTKEHALMFAELAAGRSKALLDQGERRKAIVAALKGLPKNITSDKAIEEFAAPMEALKRALRSSRVRIDIDYAQPYPMVKSVDFRRVATGVTDGAKRDMILWDAATRSELATLVSWPLSSGDITLWPQFSGDGRFITVNTGPRSAAVWSADDARRITEVEACEEGTDFAMFGMPAKLSFDGSKLYFGGCVFGLPDGKMLHRIGLAEIVGAAKSHGIETSWFRMNEGPSLQGDFVAGGNTLLLNASAGVQRRSILGLFDTDSGAYSFVPIAAEFGQVGQAYPETATSLKTKRTLLSYGQNNMQGLALLDIADGRVVWNHIGPEWSLAGLNPDGTVLIRVAPNNWEFFDALTGSAIIAPKGLERSDFETFGDVYNRTGKQIIANYPSALEDVWRDVPDGMALISKALNTLTPVERDEVSRQQIDF